MALDYLQQRDLSNLQNIEADYLPNVPKSNSRFHSIKAVKNNCPRKQGVLEWKEAWHLTAENSIDRPPGQHSRKCRNKRSL